jgi:L-2-aminoadipate reductase
VREAERRGLVGAIVRHGYVTGDPESAISVTDEFLVRLGKGCLQVGARPENIVNTVNAVPPHKSAVSPSPQRSISPLRPNRP